MTGNSLGDGAIGSRGQDDFRPGSFPRPQIRDEVFPVGQKSGIERGSGG